MVIQLESVFAHVISAVRCLVLATESALLTVID
jgi:hypothetical protein